MAEKKEKEEKKKYVSVVKPRIREYLKTVAKITPQKFYDTVGMSRGTLTNKSGLGEENVLKTIGYDKDLRLEWLLKGEGSMVKERETATVEEHGQEYSLLRIPLYNTNSKSIARLIENPQESDVMDYLTIPVENCDGAIYISGDSMYPMLKSGDIVVYKTRKDKENSLFWGEMYLVVIEVEGEEMTAVHYIQKSKKGKEYIALKSYNPQHQLKDVHLDQVLAFALVKASIKLS